MIHAREDYNRIQDPAGLIPIGEPVFLLRAQDHTAAGLVEIWAQTARRFNVDASMIQLALDHAQRMREWETKKVPDLPEDLVSGAHKPRPLKVMYKNWRNVISERFVLPLSTRWGANEWHPEPQWLMLAVDVRLGAPREFAMKDMIVCG